MAPFTLKNADFVLPDGVTTGTLHVEGDRFADSPPPGAITFDLSGYFVFPGLVNAHDHLHLNNFPPLPGSPLSQHRQRGQGVRASEVRAAFPNSYAWITAFQEHLTSPACEEAKAVPKGQRFWQGGLKNLLCGATTVAHHDPLPSVCDEAWFPVRVLKRFGWSHSLGLGLPDSSRSPLHYGLHPVESFAATPTDHPWIIHLAEGVDEIAASELDELDARGCLAENTVLVHGVGLTPQNVEKVIARRAGVVWCPGSNLGMFGRTLEPRGLMDNGRLALGSDSRLSGGFDLLDELRLAEAQSDCTPSELLRLVTEAGSRLLRMPEVGGMAPGQVADFLLLRDNGGDPYRTLLTARRSDIALIVKDGHPVVADPEFVHWFESSAVPTTRVCLDGRPKLCATALVGHPGCIELEPGLERMENNEVGSANAGTR